MPRPICPRCGEPATQVEGPNGLKSRCEPCGLYSKGNQPLRNADEHLARSLLRTARRNAHAAFDPLWQTGLLDRESAYALLALELEVDPEAAHMGVMDLETARHVPVAVR